MKLSVRILCLLSILLTTISFSCQTKKETDGPYFGNGFHNGWADQNSVVIWTRLTKNAEGNADGEKFMVPTNEVHRQLAKEPDIQKIYDLQIPEGLQLEDMIGACPGATGEVQLSYFPLGKPENKIQTEWISVDLDTYRWRGHRRLSARTYKSKCSSCVWGCRMPVTMIVDHWQPSNKRYRFETFCYGPKSCSYYNPGPQRTVPGRKGMIWEEPDWVDEDATAHRGLDE